MKSIKYLAITILFVSILAIGVFVAVNQIKEPVVNQVKEPKKVIMQANWTDQQQSFKDAYKNADLVVLGRVKSMNAYKKYGVVFTKAHLEVEKVIKGKIDDINVIFTGGTLDNVEYVAEASTLPKENDLYLFLLKDTQVGTNEYAPIAGYQGIFKVDDSTTSDFSKKEVNKLKFKEFNSKNNLEKTVLNKNVSEELDNVSKP